ncbi:hypothetical protein LX16_2627 [Stackebrandtia albiflava]|uniref:Uncharacterized protein n=1 Tax=Stackebrandtia albiflava TaxID=406432 RepID=A0A562V1W5_9ACTN|nr:hypothetical protein [Stackebrandtia albiflava]TWJ11889.1 hypothetical protein LX16_2627 [Stackebrandtia albiflava]
MEVIPLSAPTPASRGDDDREVSFDDYEILPDQTRDDTDTGWGGYARRDDDSRLLEERPPHWG